MERRTRIRRCCKRIAGIRKQLATDLGYLLPPVRVTDNIALRSREYVILLQGQRRSHATSCLQGHELAIPIGKPDQPSAGQADARSGLRIAGWWIPRIRPTRARRSGYTVVDAVSVIGTHLAELVRRHAHELFSRQDAKKLLDRVAHDNPKVVEDLVPKLLPLATVQRVLQNLLRERVSIRDAVTILEALGEAARRRATRFC